MTPAFELTLADIDRRCRLYEVPYAIIGGIAAIIHGSTRTTVDIDVTMLAELDQLERVLEIFGRDYTSMRPDPLDFFKRCLYVPLKNRDTQVRVDVAAALSGFDQLVVKRSKPFVYNGVRVNVCTFEDFVIMKLLAARTKDTLDLEELIPKYHKNLDLEYLHARAQEFILVERSDIVERLEKFIQNP